MPLHEHSSEFIKMAAINKSLDCSDTLPKTGLKQCSEFLKFLPFRKTKLYAMVKSGEFPKPCRVGSMVCWRMEDVHHWIEAQGKPDQAAANDGGL